MSWVTLVLAIVGGLVSILSTGLISGINSQKKKIDALEKENKELTARVEAADKKTEIAVADAIKTREEVIAMLKKEIAETEAQLASNADPVVVRSRLGKLLSDG